MVSPILSQNLQKPLIKYITDFLEYCEIERGLRPISIKNYAQFLNAFVHWLSQKNLDNLKPQDITVNHIWQYRIYLSRQTSHVTGKSLSNVTQNHYLIALRALLAYFVEQDIKSLPPGKIKLAKENSRSIKFLNLEQLEKLLESPNTKSKKGLRDRAILETLFSTGVRVGELVSLNVDQLNLKNPPKDKTLEVAISGKGGSPRVVFFSERCLFWINQYLKSRNDKDEALFINFRNKKDRKSLRLTSRSIERVIKNYALEVGLSVFTTPHTLRHTYATDLLGQGVDLRMIQEFLGHKNIATTQVYTHVTSKKLKEIHRRYHSGSKLENN